MIENQAVQKNNQLNLNAFKSSPKVLTWNYPK